MAALQTVMLLIGTQLYSVHWTCTETAAVSCDTSHVIKQCYNHFARCIQKALFRTTDTTCGHKANGITPLITWRKGVFKEEVPDDLPWNDERGLSSVRRTLEPFQRQCWGNFWDRVERIIYMCFSKHIDTIFKLNWTENYSHSFRAACG